MTSYERQLLMEQDMRRLKLWEIETDLMLGRFGSPQDLWAAVKESLAESIARVEDTQEEFDKMEEDYVEQRDKADRLEEAILHKCQDISESCQAMEYDHIDVSDADAVEDQLETVHQQRVDIEQSVKELLEALEDPED